ncbi:hypothetical protein C8Q79DRAFT_1105101 [Trametes meyenii]|nr:hypothetical protein C8Q79DRAFT_1105101 [Trametes meyenii]
MLPPAHINLFSHARGPPQRRRALAFCAPFAVMLASLDPSGPIGSVLLPLLKIAALLATGYTVHRALSPPNPPPAPKTCIDNRTLFERAIRHVTFCSKMLTWTIVLCDALATLHLAAPTPLTHPAASLLFPGPLSSHPSPLTLLSPPSTPLPSPTPSPLPTLARTLTAPHPLLLLGAALAIAGGALRLACFRALGALFTFELTISPAHTLVTSGPYACVRHPSYAGVYAVLLGASAVMFAPGAWLREAWLVPGARAGSAWAARALGVRAALQGGERYGEAVAAAAAAVVAGGQESVGAADVGVGAGAGAVLAWAFVAFWTAKVVYALRSTNRRVGTEDAHLRRVFGAQWEEWAGRVRWKLVPWVY